MASREFSFSTEDVIEMQETESAEKASPSIEVTVAVEDKTGQLIGRDFLLGRSSSYHDNEEDALLSYDTFNVDDFLDNKEWDEMKFNSRSSKLNFPTLALHTGTTLTLFGDFGTDVLMLYRFWDIGLIYPCVFSFLMIMSPYAISYSSGIQLLLLNRYFANYTMWKKVALVFFLLPIGVIYFFVVDVLLIFYTLLLEVPYCLWYQQSHRSPTLTRIKNYIFGFMNMNSIQLEGYERQRAIAGNTFETIPQVILAFALLSGAFGEDAAKEVGTETVYISVGFAAVNLYIQFMLILLEAKSLLEGNLEYGMVCMNGRFGWVPYLNCLMDGRIKALKSDKIEYDKIVIPLSQTAKWAQLVFNYQFDDLSIRQLIDKMLYLEKKLDKELWFGTSCNFVSLHSMLQLIRASDQKAVVNLSRVDWLRCIKVSVSLGHNLEATTGERSMLHEILTFAPANVRSDIVIWILWYLWDEYVKASEKDKPEKLKQLDMINTVDVNTDSTILMRCVMSNYKDLATKLLQLNARGHIKLDVSKGGSVHNPLSLAISLDSDVFVKLLIEYQADPFAVIQNKRTPFSVLLETRKFHLLSPMKISKDHMKNFNDEIFQTLTDVLIALIEDKDFENFRVLQSVFFGDGERFLDKDGNTLLHCLARDFPFDKLKLQRFIEMSEGTFDDDEIINDEGQSAVEIAMSRGAVQWIQNIDSFVMKKLRRHAFLPDFFHKTMCKLSPKQAIAYIWKQTKIKLKVWSGGAYTHTSKVMAEIVIFEGGSEGKQMKTWDLTYGGNIGAYLGVKEETQERVNVGLGLNCLLMDFHGNFISADCLCQSSDTRMKDFLMNYDKDKHIIVVSLCGEFKNVHESDMEVLKNLFNADVSSTESVGSFILINEMVHVRDSFSGFADMTFNVSGGANERRGWNRVSYSLTTRPDFIITDSNIDREQFRNRCYFATSGEHYYIDVEEGELRIWTSDNGWRQGDVFQPTGLIHHLDSRFPSGLPMHFSSTYNLTTYNEKAVRPCQIHIRGVDVWFSERWICGFLLRFSNDEHVMLGRIDPAEPDPMTIEAECGECFANIEIQKCSLRGIDIPESARGQNWNYGMKRMEWITNMGSKFIVEPDPENAGKNFVEESFGKEDEILQKIEVNSLRYPCITKVTTKLAKEPFSTKKKEEKKEEKKETTEVDEIEKAEDGYNKKVAMDMISRLNIKMEPEVYEECVVMNDDIRPDLIKFEPPHILPKVRQFWWDQHKDIIETCCEFKVPPVEDIRPQKFNYFEAFCRIFNECVSFADLITDAIIINKLFQANQIVFSTLSVATVLTPYLIAYSSLNNFFSYRRVFTGSKLRKFLGLWFMTPVCIVYFLIMDIAFMFQTIINDLLSVITLREHAVDTELSESFFLKIGLTLMDVKGYRRQRTLSQLTFESIPQIALQSVILSYANGETASDLDIDGGAIELSIAFAVAHFAFESLVMIIESRAARMPFFHYVVLCLCGRFGWCPFHHMIHDERYDDKGPVLDYTDMSFRGWLTVKITYEFSRSTLHKLIEVVGYLKQDIQKFPQYIIILDGLNINKCPLEDICLLMSVCRGRVELLMRDVSWEELVLEHHKSRIEQGRDLWSYGAENEDLLKAAVQYQNFELLRAILELECDPNREVGHGQSALHLAIAMNQTGDDFQVKQIVKTYDAVSDWWVVGQVKEISEDNKLTIESLNITYKDFDWNNADPRPWFYGLDFVNLLLKSGAKLNTFMNDGTTPLDSAMDLRNNESMLQLLFQHGVEFSPEQEDRICDQVMELVKIISEEKHCSEQLRDVVRLVRILGSMNGSVGVKDWSLHSRLETIGSAIIDEMMDLPEKVAVNIREAVGVQWIPRTIMERLRYVKRKNLWPLGIIDGRDEESAIDFTELSFGLQDFRHFFVALQFHSPHVRVENCDLVGSQLGIANGLSAFYLHTCDLEKRTFLPDAKSINISVNVGYRNLNTRQEYGRLRLAEKLLELKLQDEVIMVSEISISADVIYEQVQTLVDLPLAKSSGFFIVISDEKGSRQRQDIIQVDMSKPQFVLENFTIPCTRYPRIFERLVGGKTIELWVSTFRWKPWNLNIKTCSMEIKYQRWYQTMNQVVNLDARARTAMDYDIYMTLPSGDGVRFVCPPYTQMISFLNKSDPALQISSEQLLSSRESKGASLTVEDPRAKASLRDVALENDFTGNMRLDCSIQEKYEWQDPVQTRFETMFGELSRIFKSKEKIMVFLPHAFPDDREVIEKCLLTMIRNGDDHGIGVIYYEHPEKRTREDDEKKAFVYPSSKHTIEEKLIIYKTFINNYPYAASIFDVKSGKLLDILVPQNIGRIVNTYRSQVDWQDKWNPWEIFRDNEELGVCAEYHTHVAVISYSATRPFEIRQQLELFQSTFENLQDVGAFVLELVPELKEDESEKGLKRNVNKNEFEEDEYSEYGGDSEYSSEMMLTARMRKDVEDRESAANYDEVKWCQMQVDSHKLNKWRERAGYEDAAVHLTLFQIDKEKEITEQEGLPCHFYSERMLIFDKRCGHFPWSPESMQLGYFMKPRLFTDLRDLMYMPPTLVTVGDRRAYKYEDHGMVLSKMVQIALEVKMFPMLRLACVPRNQPSLLATLRALYPCPFEINTDDLLLIIDLGSRLPLYFWGYGKLNRTDLSLCFQSFIRQADPFKFLVSMYMPKEKNELTWVYSDGSSETIVTDFQVLEAQTLVFEQGEYISAIGVDGNGLSVVKQMGQNRGTTKIVFQKPVPKNQMVYAKENYMIMGLGENEEVFQVPVPLMLKEAHIQFPFKFQRLDTTMDIIQVCQDVISMYGASQKELSRMLRTFQSSQVKAKMKNISKVYPWLRASLSEKFTWFQLLKLLEVDVPIEEAIPTFMEVFGFAGPYQSLHLSRRNLGLLNKHFPKADLVSKIPGFEWKIKQVRDGRSLIASVLCALWNEIPWLCDLGTPDYWTLRIITSFLEEESKGFYPNSINCHLGLQIPITAKRNLVVSGFTVSLYYNRPCLINAYMLKTDFPPILGSKYTEIEENWVMIGTKTCSQAEASTSKMKITFNYGHVFIPAGETVLFAIHMPSGNQMYYGREGGQHVALETVFEDIVKPFVDRETEDFIMNRSVPLDQLWPAFSLYEQHRNWGGCSVSFIGDIHYHRL